MGIFQESDFEASAKGYKLIVKKAVPGTYFVLLGTAIIVTTIWKGLDSEELIKKNIPQNAKTQIQPIDSLMANDSLKLK